MKKTVSAELKTITLYETDWAIVLTALESKTYGQHIAGVITKQLEKQV